MGRDEIRAPLKTPGWEANWSLEGLVFEKREIPEYPDKNLLEQAGFSIEGGTRRLIAAYFGIYSRLLCV